ncbi:hypothetical protein JIQ42_08142 [Leishmania sp. Namibia]|uniref:hypothetical protein n=1 Tax=Leishmania sp. Namibia TaxID=2802991 RepID=UPI001B694F63|nr:hypothetical protein JIQ42_08142 [Leishmania sp. Namibia]
MQSRALWSRRFRAARFARRTLFLSALCIGALVLLSGVLIWRATDSWAEGTRVGGKCTPPFLTPGNRAGLLVPGAGTDALDGGAQPLTGHLEAAPYTESLEELLRLLRIYAEHRGVRVNHTYSAPLEAAAALAGISDDGNSSHRGAEVGGAVLQLPGVKLLHDFYGDGGQVVGHLSAGWVLDDPETIMAEQEAYVERYLVPTQAEVELTPLRVISSYYDTKRSRSLDRMAAETEKAMNDDGYATYIQRSPTFYDVSHAARRGYGQEGSIFVAVPFTLTDITSEMVDTIRRRALTALTSPKSMHPGSNATLRVGDDVVGDDGFKELRLTAARCAMTVESLFRQAHRGVAVTVGSMDVVVVSGVSAAELNFPTPADVIFPLRAADRGAAALSRRRRYSRITCEPPDFTSGWDDADYGFRWKDNLRRRRVVVPLTALDGVAGTGPTLLQDEDVAAAVAQRFALLYVGRFATLQLYRGESYVFFLRTGSLALPNWDLTLRLLYLRTPARDRAVLSSRPTPGAVWRALAASVATMWSKEPFLRLSLATASGRRSGRNNVATAPSPDERGKRLLAALPGEVSSWLSAAQADTALVLWLVTPSWLWPAMVETLADWRQIEAAPDSPPPTVAPSALHLLFANAAFSGVTRDGLSTLREVDLKTVQVDPVRSSDGAAATKASPLRKRMVHVRGGKSPATSSTPQAVLSASLTESDVYELLLLTEKRPPMPSEPIALMAQAASTKAAAQPRTSGAATRRLCGEEKSEAPYYSDVDRALLKRSFEYCWLTEHRNTLRGQVHRLLHSTQATTVLKTAPLTKTPGAGAAAAAKCRPKIGFAAAEVVLRSSTCLADMRYLEPMEAPPLTGAAGGTWDSGNRGSEEGHPLLQEQAWLTSAASVGVVKGVATSARDSEAAGGAADQPTPYVLQSAASADLLFAPAEVFFDFAPEHRLRTRARSLAEQLAERQRRHPAVKGLTAHAHIPEAVELDPLLPFMDRDLEDVYMTQALWTRGWNIFGLTEPVAVGIGESELLSSVSPAAPAASVAGDIRQCTTEQAADAVPPELGKARAFTHDRFWALLMAHREAGTPLGATEPKNGTSTPQAAPRSLYPLRRTIKEWELFSGVQLSALRETPRSP